MPNPRRTRTNAADSAPGVDDGRINAGRSSSRSATPGRGIVWVLVALTLLALLAIFWLRPTNDEADPMVRPGATQSEIQNSTIPGADNRNPAAQNR
ncbi:hypothetical protein [Phenylobacterium sp.]|uniref:hypothetical protein n=1 Tax=Phenylobacterium sp. TaxID=1871053 RepID=UPI002F9432F3